MNIQAKVKDIRGLGACPHKIFIGVIILRSASLRIKQNSKIKEIEIRNKVSKMSCLKTGHPM